MAKRFTDTNIWDKPWFMALSCKNKCVVRYLFERCDNVGVWEPNYILAGVHIGEPITELDILSVDGGKQFESLENGKIFIKDFCDFQYGELSENCKPHIPVIKRLQKLGLFERVCKGYTKGIHTLEEKDKEQEQEKEKKKGKGSGENQKTADVPDTSQKLRSEYVDLQKSFSEKDIPTIGLELKTFIETHKPTFAEPYVDAWNFFAQKRGLDKVETITKERRSKIRVRSREPSFRFFDIITSAGKSKFHMGDKGDWKLTFDYLIHNENNYVKILEQK